MWVTYSDNSQAELFRMIREGRCTERCASLKESKITLDLCKADIVNILKTMENFALENKIFGDMSRAQYDAKIKSTKADMCNTMFNKLQKEMRKVDTVTAWTKHLCKGLMGAVHQPGDMFAAQVVNLTDDGNVQIVIATPKDPRKESIDMLGVPAIKWGNSKFDAIVKSVHAAQFTPQITLAGIPVRPGKPCHVIEKTCWDKRRLQKVADTLGIEWTTSDSKMTLANKIMTYQKTNPTPDVEIKRQYDKW